jgi:DNA-binding CsgD family transcriptional regulator
MFGTDNNTKANWLAASSAVELCWRYVFSSFQLSPVKAPQGECNEGPSFECSPTSASSCRPTRFGRRVGIRHAPLTHPSAIGLNNRSPGVGIFCWSSVVVLAGVFTLVWIAPVHPATRLNAMKPHLTERQTEVVRLISLGCTNEEIALILGIAVSTADNHRAHAMTALGTDKAALVTRLALKYRITSMNDKLTPAEKRRSERKRDGWN